MQPDAHGDLWLDAAAVARALAPDASREDLTLVAAAQKPISTRCLGEPLTDAAWRHTPSWFLVAENDRMVSPETQHFIARRMNARVVSLPVDHSPLLSRPEAVTDVIEEAIRHASADRETASARVVAQNRRI